jgi:cytochrome c oxidase subunit 1
LWFIGMIIFSNSMHVLGILGAPRRTPLGEAPYIPPEWNSRLLQVGIGGGILFISAILYFVVLWKTAWRKNAEPAEVEVPVVTSLDDARPMPDWLDSWKPWLYGVVMLLILAYGPSLWEQVTNMIGSPGFRVW